MIDESLFPCLNLARTLCSEQERVSFLLHAAKAVNANAESLGLFFMIKAMPVNAWISSKEIPPDCMEKDFNNYGIEHCTDILKEFPEDCKKICTLCKYSTRFTNQRIRDEQIIITALLSNKPLYEKKSLLLRPVNFKAGFLFIIEQQFFLLPLYRLLFQYIQSCSTLEVPDNPLLDNINTPGWERIIDAFLYSSVFKRGVKWQTLSGLIQSQLLSAVKEALFVLNPRTEISLPEFDAHVKELLTRKKYVPLVFGSIDIEAGSKILVKSRPSMEPVPSPLLSAPPLKESGENSDFFANLNVTTSDGSVISGELLRGLCSPVEQPWSFQPPERIAIISSPEPSYDDKAKDIQDTSANYSYHPGIAPDQLLDRHGRYDVTQLMERHSVLPYKPEMLHSYLFDAYINGQIAIDCALCNGVDGFLLFVAGHGAAIWIQKNMDNGIYLLKTILTDASIRKITWNLPELIALCCEKEIPYPKELHSLTAAYCAAVSSAPLFPLLPIMAYGDLDPAAPDSFIQFLSNYNMIYSTIEKEVCKNSSYKTLNMWEAYERALATSIYLHPQFTEARNLTRTGPRENEFIFTTFPGCRKVMHGSCIHITILVDAKEQPRLLEDGELKMAILASIFLTPELFTFDLKLLSYKDNQCSLFINTRRKHTLRIIETLLGKIIAKKLRTAHYPPPTLTIFYS